MYDKNKQKIKVLMVTENIFFCRITIKNVEKPLGCLKFIKILNRKSFVGLKMSKTEIFFKMLEILSLYLKIKYL